MAFPNINSIYGTVKYLIAISITKWNADLISSISGWRTTGRYRYRVRTAPYILYTEGPYELVYIITNYNQCRRRKAMYPFVLRTILIYSSVIFIHDTSIGNFRIVKNLYVLNLSHYTKTTNQYTLSAIQQKKK